MTAGGGTTVPIAVAVVECCECFRADGKGTRCAETGKEEILVAIVLVDVDGQIVVEAGAEMEMYGAAPVLL